MDCTYCGEQIAPERGLDVRWRGTTPRLTATSALPFPINVFCNERCLYKYLALQLREPQVAVQLSPGRILRVLTSSGVLLIKGDSWEQTQGGATIRDTRGKVVAEFLITSSKES